MKDNNHEDKIFDAILRSAVNDVFQNEINTLMLESEDETNIPSENLEIRIRKILKKEKAKTRGMSFFSRYGKAVAIVPIVILMSIFSFFNVDAMRVFFLNTFIIPHDTYDEFIFDISSNHNNESNFTLEYIPDGFEIFDNSDPNFLILKNADEVEIFVSKNKASSVSIGIDNEYTKRSEIVINEREAFLYTATIEGNMNALLFILEPYVILITSSIDVEEIIRIANNITLN